MLTAATHVVDGLKRSGSTRKLCGPLHTATGTVAITSRTPFPPSSTPGKAEHLSCVNISMLRLELDSCFTFHAGTNDLGSMTATEILANLACMRIEATGAKVSPLALAIPRLEDGLDPVASDVNRGLREEAAKNGFPFVDISQVSEEHLCDGVHFDSAGYGEFAKLVFEQLKPLLEQ